MPTCWLSLEASVQTTNASYTFSFVAGLDPWTFTHVFEEGCVDRREGVDDRDEPGQGGLELFPGLSKQPTPLDRTAVAQGRANVSRTASPCRHRSKRQERQHVRRGDAGALRVGSGLGSDGAIFWRRNGFLPALREFRTQPARGSAPHEGGARASL